MTQPPKLDVENVDFAALLEQENVIPFMADSLAQFDARLRDLSVTMNAGIAGESEERFMQWRNDLDQWYRDVCPLAAVLIKAGFAVPPDDLWRNGTSADQLAFLNGWANLLQTLLAYFRSGAPMPSSTRN